MVGTSISKVIISNILEAPLITACLLVLILSLVSPDISNLQNTFFIGNKSREGMTSLRPMIPIVRIPGTVFGAILNLSFLNYTLIVNISIDLQHLYELMGLCHSLEGFFLLLNLLHQISSRTIKDLSGWEQYNYSDQLDFKFKKQISLSLSRSSLKDLSLFPLYPDLHHTLGYWSLELDTNTYNEKYFTFLSLRGGRLTTSSRVSKKPGLRVSYLTLDLVFFP